jgi:hypothetical protein
VKKFIEIILIIVLSLSFIFGFIFVWKKIKNDLPENNQQKYIAKYSNQEKDKYYEIFDKEKILDGSEKTAQEVLNKVDNQYQKYQSQFKDLANLTNVNNDRVMKALFIMNFVSFSNYYGNPDTSQNSKSIETLIWKIKNSNCETNSTLLEMLLEKSGYEARTIAINGLNHGYNEVKIDGTWNILDATTNIWINNSTEDILNGSKKQVQKFFLKGSDSDNPEVKKLNYSGNDLSDLRVKMTNLGEEFKPIISNYNYVDLKLWTY